MTAHDDLAPWERPATPSAFTLEESARRLGHYAWAEMRMFEILGSWAESVPEASIATLFAAHANQHAWHAELWHQRFPELREWDRSAFVRPAGDDVADAFDHLAAADTTPDRLVGTYRVVVPHLVATYTFHRNRASTVSDGPTIRSLEFVLADDTAQMADGAVALAAVLTEPDAVTAAIATQSSLEQALVASGGIAGPGTVPPLGP